MAPSAKISGKYLSLAVQALSSPLRHTARLASKQAPDLIRGVPTIAPDAPRDGLITARSASNVAAFAGSESVRSSRGKTTRVDIKWESVLASKPANDEDSVNGHERRLENNF